MLMNLTDQDMGNRKQTRSSTFGLSDCGRVRETNQDQFLIAELTKSMLVSATTLDLGSGAPRSDPRDLAAPQQPLFGSAIIQ